VADFAIPSINDPELTTCPHCGAKARLLADERFRWVCGACAGARVPSPDERAHSAAEKEHLQRSKSLVTQAHVARGVASLTAMGATGSALLAVIFLFALHVAPLFSFFLIVMSVVLSMVTIAFGRSARAKIEEAKMLVTSAWQLVVEALLKINGRPMTAAELGAMMKTTEPDAERLLTLLSVDDKVFSSVGEDAQIRYSGPQQMRVEDPRSVAPTVLAAAIQEEDVASANTVLAEKIVAPTTERK
jgi:hypothetical protein